MSDSTSLCRCLGHLAAAKEFYLERISVGDVGDESLFVGMASFPSSESTSEGAVSSGPDQSLAMTSHLQELDILQMQLRKLHSQ